MKTRNVLEILKLLFFFGFFFVCAPRGVIVCLVYAYRSLSYSASKCPHSSVGMSSSTNNIEYNVNGIQSGVAQNHFQFHIADMVSPLQTGGQSQNLNSSADSLERGNKGAKCEGAAKTELSAKIKFLRTKYKKLLRWDAVESQKVEYMRAINRTYDYLQLVEGKRSWSKVVKTVDADEAANQEECQADWAIHDDLYDEEQEIFEQLQYHFEGFECPVEIVNARKARKAAQQALLDDLNEWLVEQRAIYNR